MITQLYLTYGYGYGSAKTTSLSIDGVPVRALGFWNDGMITPSHRLAADVRADAHGHPRMRGESVPDVPLRWHACVPSDCAEQGGWWCNGFWVEAETAVAVAYLREQRAEWVTKVDEYSQPAKPGSTRELLREIDLRNARTKVRDIDIAISDRLDRWPTCAGKSPETLDRVAEAMRRELEAP